MRRSPAADIRVSVIPSQADTEASSLKPATGTSWIATTAIPMPYKD
jgi:hypothetical protein